MYKRELIQKIIHDLSQNPAVAIVGTRQAFEEAQFRGDLFS